MTPKRLAPVQLVPASDAVPGMVAELPVYDGAVCAPCRFAKMCGARGRASAFRVREIRGDPYHCARIDGPVVPCRADHDPRSEAPRPPPRPRGRTRKWLCDANVFIGVDPAGRSAAAAILARAGDGVILATTRECAAELVHDYAVPPDLVIVDVGPIDPALETLADETATLTGKRASRADLSLVQALIHDPEWDGILTADGDLFRMEVAIRVRESTGRDVRVMTCEALCAAERGRFGRDPRARARS